MDSGDIILALVVVAALGFDFTNGFHDTANAMATTIATGALRPKLAVTIAAILNFVGAFISLKVAATVAEGIVDAGAITPTVVFGGLVGAIGWNLGTWWFGLPSSSSHALIGGVVGATLVAAGSGAVEFDGIVSKVIVPALDLARPRRRHRGARRRRHLRADPPLQGGARRARVPLGAGRARPRWSRSRTAPTTRRRRWA